VSDAVAAVAEIGIEPQPAASAEPPSVESPAALDAMLSEAAGELSRVSAPAQEETPAGPSEASVPHLDAPPERSPAESEPAGATPSVSGAGSATDGPAAKPLAPLFGTIVRNAPVVILTVLDKPFANLSMGTKNVLGYIGLATLVVAMATWLAGFFIRPA